MQRCRVAGSGVEATWSRSRCEGDCRTASNDSCTLRGNFGSSWTLRRRSNTPPRMASRYGSVEPSPAQIQKWTRQASPAYIEASLLEAPAPLRFEAHSLEKDTLFL